MKSRTWSRSTLRRRSTRSVTSEHSSERPKSDLFEQLRLAMSEGEQENDPTDPRTSPIGRANPKLISRTNLNGRISGRKDVKPNTQKVNHKNDFKFDPRNDLFDKLDYRRVHLYLPKERRDQILLSSICSRAS